jgi:hypothetical protein
MSAKAGTVCRATAGRHFLLKSRSSARAQAIAAALILNTYPDHLYLAGPPVLLQKLIFALLAPLSRVRSYRLEIEPAR